MKIYSKLLVSYTRSAKHLRRDLCVRYMGLKSIASVVWNLCDSHSKTQFVHPSFATKKLCSSWATNQRIYPLTRKKLSKKLFDHDPYAPGVSSKHWECPSYLSSIKTSCRTQPRKWWIQDPRFGGGAPLHFSNPGRVFSFLPMFICSDRLTHSIQVIINIFCTEQ